MSNLVESFVLHSKPVNDGEVTEKSLDGSNPLSQSAGGCGFSVARKTGAEKAEAHMPDIIERSEQLIEQGDLLAALEQLVAGLKTQDQDEKLLTLAAGTWVAAVDKGNILEKLPGGHRGFLEKTLILQENCPVSPPILHHRIAAQHSSGNAGHLERASKMIEPALQHLLGQEKPSQNAVLMALLLRSNMKNIKQKRISDLHHAHFHEFSEDDLRIPYSVVFDSDHFGQNVADLGSYAREQWAKLSDGSLPLTHVLLLVWLVPEAFKKLPANWPVEILAARSAHGEMTANEYRAGRSLLLRFGNISELGDFSLPSAAENSLVASIAGNLESERAALAVEAQGGTNKAMERLDKRSNQLTSAAWNLASAKLPPLANIKRKPRVAICISGQLRGFRSTFPTWQPLLASIDATIFVDTWKQIGRGTPEPFRFVLPFEGENFNREYKSIGTDAGLDELRARYPRFFEKFEQSGAVSAAELSDFYDTPHVCVDEESDPEFCNLSNSEKMYVKTEKCFTMMQQSGEEFDLILRIRPDKPITAVAFDWADMINALKARPALYCETAMGVHYGALLMGDQFALGLPEASRIYAETFTRAKALLDIDLYRMGDELAGHSSFAQVCWLHGIEVCKVPIKFAPFREAEKMSGDEIRAALAEDSSGRMDGYDQRLIAANAADLNNP